MSFLAIADLDPDRMHRLIELGLAVKADPGSYRTALSVDRSACSSRSSR